MARVWPPTRSILALSISALAMLAAALVALIWWTRPGAVFERRPVVWVNPWEALPSRVDHFELASRAMGHQVGVSVQRPAHDEPAPVIYFLHGRGGDETTDLPAFLRLLRPILAQYQLPEPLVVFPNGGLTGYRGPMASMILHELIPYIDRHYNTLPEQRWRLIAGFSMGGAGAVRLALENPGVFRGAASWGGGMRDPALLELADHNAEIFKAAGAAFLLINGSADRPDAFVPLAEVLQRKGVFHQRVVLAEVNHDMDLYFDHSAHLYGQYLLALWK